MGKAPFLSVARLLSAEKREIYSFFFLSHLLCQFASIAKGVMTSILGRCYQAMAVGGGREKCRIVPLY